MQPLKSIIAVIPKPPASGGSVRLGDRYHRSDKLSTVEVVRVSEADVECESATGGYSDRFTVTLEEFRRLEAKSLEFGAVFEPAPNSEASHVESENCGECDHGRVPTWDGDGNETGDEQCQRCDGTGRAEKRQPQPDVALSEGAGK